MADQAVLSHIIRGDSINKLCRLDYLNRQRDSKTVGCTQHLNRALEIRANLYPI